MAKKPRSKQVQPWVKFERDAKTGSILMSRKEVGQQCIRLQFPRVGSDGKDEARLIFVDEDCAHEEDGGLWLDYSDVQWLAQAFPELLNEMERAGIDG